MKLWNEGHQVFRLGRFADHLIDDETVAFKPAISLGRRRFPLSPKVALSRAASHG